MIATLKAQLLGSGGLRTELIKGAVGSFSLKLVNTVLNLVLSVFLARSLTPQGYGVYAFMLSLMTLLTIPTQLGMTTLLVREVSGYQSAEQWGLLKGILRRTNQTVVVLSFVVGIAAYFLASFFADQWDATQLMTFGWALVLLPLVVLNRLREAAMLGLRRVVIGQLPEKIIQPAIYLLLVLLVSAGLGSDFSPSYAMVLSCVAAGLSLLMGLVFFYRALPVKVHDASPLFDVPSWFRSVLPLSLLSALAIINVQVDVVMLGILATKEDVGIYRVAFSGAALVIFVLTAINIILAPHIARTFNSGDKRLLQRIVISGSRLSLIAAIPVAILLVVLGAPILEFVFGEPYRRADLALAILCIAQLVTVFVGSAHVILNMSGYERVAVKGVICSTFLNFVLNTVLIPEYGVEGTAVATTVSIIVLRLYFFWAVWRYVGVWCLAIRCPFMQTKHFI